MGVRHGLNKVLRTFGRKRCWRVLYEEELHIFFTLPNIIRINKTRKDEVYRACRTHDECV
jgi:hypothetical protein